MSEKQYKAAMVYVLRSQLSLSQHYDVAIIATSKQDAFETWHSYNHGFETNETPMLEDVRQVSVEDYRNAVFNEKGEKGHIIIIASNDAMTFGIFVMAMTPNPPYSNPFHYDLGSMVTEIDNNVWAMTTCGLPNENKAFSFQSFYFVNTKLGDRVGLMFGLEKFKPFTDED